MFGQAVIVKTDKSPWLAYLRNQLHLVHLESSGCASSNKSLTSSWCKNRAKICSLLTHSTGHHRPPCLTMNNDVTQGCEEKVHVVLDLVIPKASTREKFAAATRADPTFLFIKVLLSKCWPEQKSCFPVAAKPFWGVHHALFEVDGLLLYGDIIVTSGPSLSLS